MTSAQTNLHHLTIREASELLRSQQLSPVELTQAFLDRISATDDQLHSYITVLRDQALADARQAESEIQRGEYKGPLHGIPFALKDLYDTAGVPTTAGSRVDIERVPTEDATTTARLKGAGAILLGKLAMHEFALGGPDFTTPFPAGPQPLEPGPRYRRLQQRLRFGGGFRDNAWRRWVPAPAVPSEVPPRCAASWGLKATYGRVSRAGVVTLSWSQDHCGPMTWTVEDTAYMLQALAGYDPKDPTTSRAPVPDYSLSLREDIRGLTIGVPRHFFFATSPDINPEVVSTVEKALQTLQGLGANIQEVTIPSLEYVRAANSIIMLSEAYAFHEKNLKSRPEEYGEMVRARFRIGGLLSASDYVQAQRVRKVAIREFAQVLQGVDVLVTPTMTQPAAAFEGFDGTSTVRGPSFTAPFNLTGLPAISVPCGFTEAGLPVGMQIAGKPFDEPGIMRAAYTYQQQAGWFRQRPPI